MGGVHVCDHGEYLLKITAARPGDAEPQQVESAGSDMRKSPRPQVHWILQVLTKFKSQNLCIFMNI